MLVHALPSLACHQRFVVIVVVPPFTRADEHFLIGNSSLISPISGFKNESRAVLRVAKHILPIPLKSVNQYGQMAITKVFSSSHISKLLFRVVNEVAKSH
jgi:hypothetical protein